MSSNVYRTSCQISKSYRKANDFVYWLRDNHIKSDYKHEFVNGQYQFLFSIRGSEYMSFKQAKKLATEFLVKEAK